MVITTNSTDGTLFAPVLPSGPVTEMRWYRTRPEAGLLVVFRHVKDGEAESVTFTTRIGGKIRRLRVIQQ